jgi:hypothetical protein
MGKARKKELLERPRYRWDSGIRMDRREVGRSAADWTNVVQDRDRW